MLSFNDNLSDNKVEYDHIIYSLNENTLTAAIAGSKHIFDLDIIIPRSIRHKSKEYIVTNILKKSFKYSPFNSIKFESNSEIQIISKKSFANASFKSIAIPPQVTRIERYAFYFCLFLQKIEIPIDSKLHTIEKKAFYNSKIESFTIPSQLVELKDGWCSWTSELKKVDVSPDNPYFKSYDDKFVIQKLALEQTNYNRLIFCVRNVERVTLPSFIECIGPFAFSECLNLKHIEIPVDSKLHTIEKKAFTDTKIESITIPSKLVELKDKWCNWMSNLNKVDISPDNQYFKLYDDKFVIQKSTLEQTNYDRLIFCIRNVKTVKLPSFIEHICPFAFNLCKKIQQIEIPIDSKLKTIECYAFANSSIKEFVITSQVTRIGKRAFAWCEQLQKIEFQSGLKLQSIEKEAFHDSSINTFSIPLHIKEIGQNAFHVSKPIQIIEFCDNFEIDSFNPKDFNFSDNAIIMSSIQLSKHIRL